MKLKDSLIIILAVIIAIVVGVFVGYKLSENKKDDNVTNNGTTNNNNQEQNNSESDKEANNSNENFTVDDAKKLMDKYLMFNNYYIDELSDENKNGLSIKNLKGTKHKSDYCYELFGENYYEDDMNGYCGNNEYIYSYSYNDVLNMKKKLFGNKQDLEKNYFEYRISMFLYSEQSNSFIDTGTFGGGDSLESYESGISDYKFLNGTLSIYLYQKTINQDGRVISVVNREYIFNYEDNNYYLAEINKLN